MNMHTVPSTMKCIFHADLSDAHPGEEYWLQACGRRYKLIPHTKESRQILRSKAPEFTSMPDECLTHYNEEAVELPADSVVRVHIKHSLNTFPNAKGKSGVSNVAIHCPPDSVSLANMAAKGEISQQSINYVTTGMSLVYHHPDIINQDPETARIIFGYMLENKQIKGMFDSLGTALKQMGPPTETSGGAFDAIHSAVKSGYRF